MNNSLEYSIEIQTSAATLYAIYTDVSRWHEWDPDTKAASLDGPMRLGAKGKLTPRKGLPVKMQVMQLNPEKGYLVECPVLGSRMRFDHRIDVLGPMRVRATHQVSFHGWLAGVLYRMVGRDLHTGLPVTLKSLKHYAEARSAP